MDLAQVRTFLAVSEELHFGRAAERLYLSQPRVSRLVASLEREVGGALFQRTSRRVRLTPLGVRLRDRLRPAYDQLQAAIDDARVGARETAGLLRIGFTSTTEGERLTRLVEAFEARHEDCEVLLREANISDPYAALRRDEIDVLVNWLAIDEPDLTAGPTIDHQERVLAVSATHPLATRPSVSLEDLGDYEVIRLASSFPTALYDALVPPRTPSGRPIRRTTRRSRALHEILSQIALGRIVHPTVASLPLAGRQDIVLVPIRDLPPLPLGLIWCSAHENARIRALADVAAQLPPAA